MHRSTVLESTAVEAEDALLRGAEVVEGRRRGRWTADDVGDDASELARAVALGSGFGATIARPAGGAETCEAPP